MPDICVAFVAAAAAGRVKVLLQKAKSGPPETPPGAAQGRLVLAADPGRQRTEA
jgi:hypothetical protein